MTSEDIIEEIVGEIADEFDRPEDKSVRIDSGYLCSGRLLIDDANHMHSWNLPVPDDVGSLDGLIYWLAGRPPQLGETFLVPGYRLTVADVRGNRVLEVRIETEQHTALQLTEESLADMVRLGMQQGELSPESIDAVKGILAAADMAVGKLRTPLPKVISVPATATTTELAHVALDSAFSRIAVFRHAPECIVGIVHVKDLFARLYRGWIG